MSMSSMSMPMASSFSNCIATKTSPSSSHSSMYHAGYALHHTQRMLHFSTILPYPRRSFAVKSGVEPLQSSSTSDNPPQADFGGRKTWIAGFVLAILVPFMKNKFGPLSLLKNKIDTVIDTAEDVAEVVEKVAEDVEKMAENVEKELPNGKLKVVVSFVENVAKEAAKDAHLVDGVLHEVEEMEENVETLVNSYSSSDKAKNASAVEIKNNGSNKL